MMRMLCGAWLVPATSLIWIGLAATEIRQTGDASHALALGRTQATAIVLAAFTVLTGASAFVRQPPVADLAGNRDANGSGDAGEWDTGGRPGPALGTPWIWTHLFAAVLAVPTALVGAAVETLAPVLFPVAALGGFWAGLAVARALVRYPGAWSGPLAALAGGISFQLTVGWLHLAHPSATASPILIMEGLILAWAAASAARVDPFAPPALALAERPSAELVGSTAGFSPGPAQPSIPEAAVGR